MTIAAGLFAGLTRESAARFAFLMGTPIIGGAVLWKARVLAATGLGSSDALALAAGMAGAAVAGLAAIAILLDYLRRHTTAPFMAERVAMAGLVVVFVLSR